MSGRQFRENSIGNRFWESGTFGADETTDPSPRGLRDYGVGAQILLDLGVRDMITLSGTRPKPAALEGYGLSIIDWQTL